MTAVVTVTKMVIAPVIVIAAEIAMAMVTEVVTVILITSQKS